jgi:hypothetical protein
VNSGHAVHMEDPKIIIRILVNFGNELQKTGN